MDTTTRAQARRCRDASECMLIDRDARIREEVTAVREIEARVAAHYRDQDGPVDVNLLLGFDRDAELEEAWSEDDQDAICFRWDKRADDLAAVIAEQTARRSGRFVDVSIDERLGTLSVYAPIPKAVVRDHLKAALDRIEGVAYLADLTCFDTDGSLQHTCDVLRDELHRLAESS